MPNRGRIVTSLPQAGGYLFRRSMHTYVLSDLHLSEAHVSETKRPLWMAYKREEHFVDEDVADLLDYLDEQHEQVELVLNGDIFDFDNVMALPESPPEKLSWLARLRGLGSQEWMSCFKLRRIIQDHPVFFRALRQFLASKRGHRVVFVIGNHDIDLMWPKAQRMVQEALGFDQARVESEGRLRFCEWFYISNGDTFVSHGHQYDPNCASDPVEPFIRLNGKVSVRTPFGDLAARLMLNGMGYFNPHATQNYIMRGVDYAKFFLKYMLWTQPFLAWSWLWSASATFYVALRTHLAPPVRDPTQVESRVASIAKKANATSSMVRQLRALDEPSVLSRPWDVFRELWLDRAAFFALLLCVAWQIVLHINIAVAISPAWVVLPLIVLLPSYVAYARKVKSGVFEKPLLNSQRAAVLAKITGVGRVVFGHTHVPLHEQVGPVEVINGGFWSPAFADPACTQRLGTQTLVHIARDADGGDAARVKEWRAGFGSPRPLAVGPLPGAFKSSPHGNASAVGVKHTPMVAEEPSGRAHVESGVRERVALDPDGERSKAS